MGERERERKRQTDVVSYVFGKQFKISSKDKTSISRLPEELELQFQHFWNEHKKLSTKACLEVEQRKTSGKIFQMCSDPMCLDISSQKNEADQMCSNQVDKNLGQKFLVHEEMKPSNVLCKLFGLKP